LGKKIYQIKKTQSLAWLCVFARIRYFFFVAKEKERQITHATQASAKSVISTLSQPRLCDITPSKVPAVELPT
jgi:hypothetical protein